MSELRQSLDQLSDAAESLWQEYLAKGPGCFDDNRLAPFETALITSLESLAVCDALPRGDWLVEFDAAVGELQPLLKRCVERSEGLSFVTGEAGLIPRRDLHERCEFSLDALRQLVDEFP